MVILGSGTSFWVHRMWSGTNVWVGHEMSEMSGWSICFYISIFQYLISMGFPMVYKSTLLNEQPFLGMTRSRWEESKFFGLKKLS